MAASRLTPPPPWGLVCALLLMLSQLGGCGGGQPAVGLRTVPVELGGRRFVLELALTPEQRHQGLSDRPAIAPDGGMLFVFPDDRVAVQQFVMRRCLVPIDIAFLDREGRVLAMHAMAVQPPETAEADLVRYSSRYPAQFAIELAGGTLADLELSPGDRVELPLAALKARAR